MPATSWTRTNAAPRRAASTASHTEAGSRSRGSAMPVSRPMKLCARRRSGRDSRHRPAARRPRPGDVSSTLLPKPRPDRRRCCCARHPPPRKPGHVPPGTGAPPRNVRIGRDGVLFLRSAQRCHQHHRYAALGDQRHQGRIVLQGRHVVDDACPGVEAAPPRRRAGCRSTARRRAWRGPRPRAGRAATPRRHRWGESPAGSTRRRHQRVGALRNEKQPSSCLRGFEAFAAVGKESGVTLTIA